MDGLFTRLHAGFSLQEISEHGINQFQVAS